MFFPFFYFTTLVYRSAKNAEFMKILKIPRGYLYLFTNQKNRSEERLAACRKVCEQPVEKGADTRYGFPFVSYFQTYVIQKAENP